MCYMKIAEDGFPMVIALSVLVSATTYWDGNIKAIKGEELCFASVRFTPLL